jgi:hypothetical protein
VIPIQALLRAITALFKFPYGVREASATGALTATVERVREPRLRPHSCEIHLRGSPGWHPITPSSRSAEMIGILAALAGAGILLTRHYRHTSGTVASRPSGHTTPSIKNAVSRSRSRIQAAVLH